MKTFEQATQAMIDADREGGHIGEDDPEWGRYEVMLGAALRVIQQRVTSADNFAVEIDEILKGRG